MGKRAANIIIETEKELKVLIKKATNKNSKLRLETALLIVTQPLLTRSQISVLMGVNKRTIERWILNYKEGGLKAYLAQKPKAPKKSVVTSAIHEALSAKLKDERRAFRGYYDAQKWIQDEFGIFINYQTLRSYMIRHFGKRLKVSRKILFIKDKHYRDSQSEGTTS